MRPLGVRNWRRRPRRVKHVAQLAATDCGAACLAMLMAYHGRPVSLNELRDLCAPGRDGINANVLCRVAREFGFAVRSWRIESPGPHSVPLPCIAHWRFNHFVVIERIEKGRVRIVDPGAGRQWVDAKEFDQAFTGVVLTLEPGAGMSMRTARVPQRSPLWRYLAQVRHVEGALPLAAQLLGATVILQTVGLLVPLCTKIVLDVVLPGAVGGLLPYLALGMAGVVMTQAVVAFARSRVLIGLRGTVDAALTRRFVSHLLSLPLRFFQQHSSGDLLMRLGSNTVIREALTAQLLSVVLDGAMVLTVFVVVTSISPRFAALAVLLAAVQIVVMRATYVRLRDLTTTQLSRQAAEQGYLVEMVKGIQAIKAGGAEERALERWAALFHDSLRTSLARGALSAGTDTAIGAVRTSSPLVILLVGAHTVLTGGMSIGTMFALSALLSTLLTPLGNLVISGQQLQLVNAHLTRVMDVFESEAEPEGGALVRELTGAVELRHVSFRYDAHGPIVIKDVSFSVGAGEKVALVGATGSGKSTLLGLMVGMLEPSEGEVLYDGVPLKEFSRRSLRSQCGVVLQEPQVFSGTIRQNIALTSPAAGLSDVMAAADVAAVAEDIASMPMRYETVLSEGGSTLSGGQRQRLTLARAVLPKPRVLFLDEATSHLDSATEARVNANLSTLRATRVIAAHRLSTVMDADVIIVLEQGRVIEQGPHDHLLCDGGTYARLYRAQSQRTVA